MANLTVKELDVLSHVLMAEEMACKKANVYANTLTDTALAEMMASVAQAHKQRFESLRCVLGGKA